MKKNFIFLSLIVFSMITCGKALADATQSGFLYEYIYSPTRPSADKAAVINWMKSNFDEHNIMLVSASNQTFKEGTWTIYVNSDNTFGIDSFYLKSFTTAEARNLNWQQYSAFDTLPYAVLGHQATDILAYTARAGNPSAAFPAFRAIIEEAEAELGEKIPALTPITNFTTDFVDGSLKGSMSFAINNDLYEGTNTLNVRYNFILAEAYHKYGSEEHYFVPLKYMYGLSGNLMPLPKNQPRVVGFDFPIDPTWNYKYLYVIAIVEGIPGSGFTNCLDVAVNKVPDMSDFGTTQPLKLEIQHNDINNQCLKIPEGDDINIVYRISNPTQSTIKAYVYIDKNKTTLNEFYVNLNKDTVTIAPGANTTVIATVVAPSMPNAAGFTIGVLPLDATTGQMPVISEVKTVIASNTITTLVLGVPGELEIMMSSDYSNSYKDEMTFIPIRYHDVINTESFAGYIYSNITPYITGTNTWWEMESPTSTLKSSSVTFGDNFRDYMSEDLKIYKSNHLVQSELTFLNDIIAKGKHLALFIDKSAQYATSSFATTNEKAAYQSLFNSLGVSYKSEISLWDNDGNLVNTIASGETTDDLGIRPDENQTIPIQFYLNTSNGNNEVYFTDWNITNSTTTKRIFLYNSNGTTNAALKVTKGNQKMLLAGFGMYSNYDVDNIGYFFDNITSWWYGIRKKLKPRMDIYPTEYNLGIVTIGEDTPVETEIEIKSIGQPEEGPIIIYSMGFTTNDGTSFTIQNWDGSKPDTIEAGESKIYKVIWNPELQSSYMGILEIRSNDPTNTIWEVTFTGQANEGIPMEPNINIDQANTFHAFTTESGVPIGTTTGTTWYPIISNIGNKILTIHSIKFSDNTDTDVYSFIDPAKIASISQINAINGYVEIGIKFNTSKVGEFDGQLIIESDDPDTPALTLDLYGKVVEPDGIQEEIAKVFNCSVNPNPINGVATIIYNILGDLPQQLQMNIIDNSGRYITNIISDTKAPGSYTEPINVKALANGTYYLEYIVGGKRSATPIVISR